MRENKIVTAFISLLLLGLCSGVSGYIGQDSPGASGFVFALGVVIFIAVLIYTFFIKPPS